MIKLINGDGELYVRITPNKRYEVAIIDPPYGIGESSKNHKSRNTPVVQKNGAKLNAIQTNYGNEDWDNEKPSQDYFHHLKRISKHQIVFGANYFPELTNKPHHKPPRRDDYDNYIKDNPTGYIIWDKVNGDNDFSDCEVIKTSFNFPSYVLYYMWNGMMQGKSLKEGTTQQGNKKLNEKRIHPTQKPVVIYKYLLSEFCQLDDNILDTYHGSGSLTIACFDLGYVNLTALENNDSIYHKAKKRIEDHISQLMLF